MKNKQLKQCLKDLLGFSKMWKDAKKGKGVMGEIAIANRWPQLVLDHRITAYKHAAKLIEYYAKKSN